MSAQPGEIPVLEGQTVIDDLIEGDTVADDLVEGDDPCCEECWDWRTGKVGR